MPLAPAPASVQLNPSLPATVPLQAALGLGGASIAAKQDTSGGFLGAMKADDRAKVYARLALHTASVATSKALCSRSGVSGMAVLN